MDHLGSPNASRIRKVVVIGAGPVGCLSALSWAKRGFDVELYEGRDDMRLPSVKATASQRSVNLAISSRGITALRSIDEAATKRILDTAIPMRSRMIHTRNGGLDSQPYDRQGQYINSIDRALLNEALLDAAAAVSNIRTFFRHKLLTADFERRILTVENSVTQKPVEVAFDVCIGADGSYSNVRRQMMRIVRMDYEQEYIPHDYLELRIPAGRRPDGAPAFLLEPNHLHIWPRHSFMLIALPNKDCTFTCTLFAPTADFERIGRGQKLLHWFRGQFPDALDLIGDSVLLQSFETNPRNSLISIKATPYHFEDKVILLGDAAHSMVPFYGQGLNCGLEDVRVLENLLVTEGVAPIAKLEDIVDGNVDTRMATALEQYTSTRHDDLVAICELAMHNYVEMRHSVTERSYLLRKALDNFLASASSVLFWIGSPPPTSMSATAADHSVPAFSTTSPSGWLPLYTMVTFRPDISYAVARRKAKRQDRIVAAIVNAGAISVLAGAVAAGTFVYRRLKR